MANLVHLRKFGTSSPQTYLFKNVSSADSSFSATLSSVLPSVGQDGGNDLYRNGRAPIPSKTISGTFWLVADHPELMTAERDRALEMLNWGVQPLVLLPFDQNQPRRYCWARCLDLSMPESAESYTDRYQRVDGKFSVSDPRWYSREGLWWIGEDDIEIGDEGIEILGSRYSVALSGTSQDIPLVQAGSQRSPMRVAILSEAATLSGIQVEYLDASNVVLEKWTWSGILSPGEQLVVDTEDLSVTYHISTGPSISGWDGFSIVSGSGFISAIPRGSTLRISGTINGGTILIDYEDTWF